MVPRSFRSGIGTPLLALVVMITATGESKTLIWLIPPMVGASPCQNGSALRSLAPPVPKGVTKSEIPIAAGCWFSGTSPAKRQKNAQQQSRL